MTSGDLGPAWTYLHIAHKKTGRRRLLDFGSPTDLDLILRYLVNTKNISGKIQVNKNMYVPSEIISQHCAKGKVSGQIFTNLPLVNVKCMH